MVGHDEAPQGIGRFKRATIDDIVSEDGTSKIAINNFGVSVSTLLVLNEGANIRTGTVTGSKIGDSATNKLAFYGATPIIQPSGVAVTDAGIHAALVTLGLITA